MKQEDVTLFKIDSIHLGRGLEDAVAVYRETVPQPGAGIFYQYNVVLNPAGRGVFHQ